MTSCKISTQAFTMVPNRLVTHLHNTVTKELSDLLGGLIRGCGLVTHWSLRGRREAIARPDSLRCWTCDMSSICTRQWPWFFGYTGILYVAHYKLYVPLSTANVWTLIVLYIWLFRSRIRWDVQRERLAVWDRERVRGGEQKGWY